jgi:phosphatidylserine/phosphatidylglycerophosphate/cardiolipin synthase-like enzyme
MKLTYLLVVICATLSINQQAQAADCPKLNVCFTPGGQCGQTIEREIAKAKESILVQAYSFTSSYIAKALVAADKRGVKVSVIIDRSWFVGHDHLSWAMAYLYHHNIPISIDYRATIAHNKIIIIDKQTVLTGSYNFTVSADKTNVENLVTIASPAIAARYTENWLKREEIAKKLPLYNPDDTHQFEQFKQQLKTMDNKQQSYRKKAIQRSVQRHAKSQANSA